MLEFRRVSFAYPHTERLILKDVSLTLREGESLSIVGMNGAERPRLSSFFAVCTSRRRGDPSQRVNIAHIPYSEYLRYLGVVFQDFQLFAFSMRENITLQGSENGNTVEACVEKSRSDGKASFSAAGARDQPIQRIDENGIEIFRGEQQKLALAGPV